MSTVRTPWLNNYGDIPAKLEYKTGTMWEAVADVAAEYPDYVAYAFMGSRQHIRNSQGTLPPAQSRLRR